MLHEHSYGAVIFRKEEKSVLYLLLYRKAHLYYKESWDFPRGLVEKGELPRDVAKREIKEETGITALSFIEGFEEEVNWIYRKGKQIVNKKATYFLAETKIKEIKISSEHDEFTWCTYEEAVKLMKFENTKTVLKKAEEFLKNRLNN